jgi:hypothetical protein
MPTSPQSTDSTDSLTHCWGCGFLSLRISWVLWQKRVEGNRFLFGRCVCVFCFPVSVVESCCFFYLTSFLSVWWKNKIHQRERERERKGGRERERESLKLMWFFYSGLRGNKCELLYLKNLAYFLHGSMNQQWCVPSTTVQVSVEWYIH